MRQHLAQHEHDGALTLVLTGGGGEQLEEGEEGGELSDDGLLASQQEAHCPGAEAGSGNSNVTVTGYSIVTWSPEPASGAARSWPASPQPRRG